MTDETLNPLSDTASFIYLKQIKLAELDKREKKEKPARTDHHGRLIVEKKSASLSSMLLQSL